MTAREKLLPLLEEKGADCALLLDEVSIRWLTRFAASDGAAVVDRTVVRLLVDPRYYAAAKDAAIQALYEQLVMELGEPEEPGTNVAFMVENDGLSPEDYIADTETEQPPLYDTVRGGIEAGAHGAQEYEKWVLADGILYPGMVVDALMLRVEPEAVTDENVALLVTLGVNNNSSSVVLTVTMRLISAADTEVARYQDDRAAKYIEERIAEQQARAS